MLLNNSCQEKPDIEYPTHWGYKIIGRDEEQLRACIAEIVGDKEYTCSVGNRSKNGKFVTYNARCVVENEEERYAIFKAFEAHGCVEMVL
jgi:putative lipoic acid-binding regulatory protein